MGEKHIQDALLSLFGLKSHVFMRPGLVNEEHLQIPGQLFELQGQVFSPGTGLKYIKDAVPVLALTAHLWSAACLMT